MSPLTIVGFLLLLTTTLLIDSTWAKRTEVVCLIPDPFIYANIKFLDGYSSQLISKNPTCTPFGKSKDSWIKGIKVKGNCNGQIKKGTGIGKFEDGETNFRGNSHAALFISCDDKEIQVLHQGGSMGQQIESFKYDGSGNNDGSKYYVVTVEA